MNTPENLSTDMKTSKLIGIHNALNPTEPLTAWKTGKPKLIARIEELRSAVSAPPESNVVSIETAKKPASDTVQKETGNDAVRTIRSAAIELLCHEEHFEDRDEKPSDENRLKKTNPKARSVGLPYDEIIRRIQVEFPDCKTSVACLRWYSVKIRVEEHGYENLRLPQRRPRVKPRTAS